MAKKGDSYEALFLLLQWDGVPPKMIFGGSKKQTLGNFKRKVTDAGFHLRQMELESPWQMAAEGGIRELKRGSGTKMNKMKSPKVLWDDYLELKAYIRSNMDLDIFELGGIPPETIIPKHFRRIHFGHLSA